MHHISISVPVPSINCGRFKAGQPLEDGALRVLEQLPGISHQVWVVDVGMGERKMGGFWNFW